MAKINLKNSIRNPLVEFLKNRRLVFSSMGRSKDSTQITEKIKVFATNPSDVSEILAIANNYGIHLYHDTTVENNMIMNKTFKYSANTYENVTSEASELELPNFYVENINEQNLNSIPLKALQTDYITRSYITDISSKQSSLNARTPQQLLKFKNILFGNKYLTERSTVNLEQFPYYNTISTEAKQKTDTVRGLMQALTFREEMLGGLISYNESINVDFLVGEDNITAPVRNIINLLTEGSFTLDTSDKLILGSVSQNSNYMSDGFKRVLIKDALYSNMLRDMLSFREMYNNTEVPKETLVYKIDKFVDNDSTPVQSFWTFDRKKYHDYQIKRDKIYRYKLSCYCLLYGTETRVASTQQVPDGVIVTITSTPSYMYAVLDFDEIFAKVSPKILMPPFVHFSNENNADNFIKIYLSLKYGSAKGSFTPILDSDLDLFEGIDSEDGEYTFDYESQDGKFEVYRVNERPKSYEDFEDAKILDVRNSVSTTDVIYRQDVKPNKKYYFMFRTINVIGIPSNPSPVYEVELIKMASESKVVVSTIEMEEKKMHHDKPFKSLLQIKPAFQQDIFDDQNEQVQDMPTFKNKINDITLGTATDKVWDKKFKIRVKSKDTGKIIDLNVKFNLIKDNIN